MVSIHQVSLNCQRIQMPLPLGPHSLPAGSEPILSADPLLNSLLEACQNNANTDYLKTLAPVPYNGSLERLIKPCAMRFLGLLSSTQK